jgi:CBS domain-containing protein
MDEAYLLTEFTTHQPIVNVFLKMNFQPPMQADKPDRSYAPVRDYMATALITFSPEDEMQRVINVLVEQRITGAPVIDQYQRLVGMISEYDCLRVMIDSTYLDQPSHHHTVSRYMSKDVQTVSPDMTVDRVAELFLNSHYRRFPVIYNGKVIGQISRSDLIRAAQYMHSASWDVAK